MLELGRKKEEGNEERWEEEGIKMSMSVKSTLWDKSLCSVAGFFVTLEPSVKITNVQH